MKTYWNTTDRLKVIPEWQPNCWIQVTCPTNEDQYELEERFNIPDYFFPDISDTDERARYEYVDGWRLITLRERNTFKNALYHRSFRYYT